MALSSGALHRWIAFVPVVYFLNKEDTRFALFFIMAKDASDFGVFTHILVPINVSDSILKDAWARSKSKFPPIGLKISVVLHC